MCTSPSAVLQEIPDYPVVIKHPMDLKTAREKVRAGAYTPMDEWRTDMKLIWDNCRTYNGEDHPFTRRAEKLEAAMQRRMEEALAGAAREVSVAQRAGAGGLASKGIAGGRKAKASGEVALLHASSTPAGSDSDGKVGGRQAGPAPRTVSSSKQHLGLASRKAACSRCDCW
ncbi:Bromodomain-containing protein [Scenedesmus sp. NREL 46B-D3]|nr:Bromodomain-containing protein [Scenedesmus sp. NREL 46B-D3]